MRGVTMLALLLVIWLSFVGAALASPEASSAIEPDRADTTESVQTVPPGAVQIETGIEYARTSLATQPAERRLAVQAGLRIGLTDRFEVSLDGEPLVRLRGAEEDTDHGDLTLGFKYRFFDSAEGRWWPSFGAQSFVKVPIADTPIGSERADFGITAIASFDLPRELSLDLNAGFAVVGQTRPNGCLLQARASASLGQTITARLASFEELSFASRQERAGRDSVGLAVGLIYQLTPRTALDAAAGTSLAGTGPDYTARVGVSVRFGR